MKFFTKEWINLAIHSNIYIPLNVSKSAETFSEDYYQNLYTQKLKEHLKLYKEMSELTADDVFNPNAWNSLSIVNSEGDFVDASLYLSQNELESIRDDIRSEWQEAYNNFEPIIYDEEVMTKQFHDMIDSKREVFEAHLPADILNDIVDIRVLLLDHVSEDIYKRITNFCNQKEEKASKIEQEYQKYYDSISAQLPENIRNNYGFHDCKIANFEQKDTDIIIELDHREGYTNICKVIYHNATVIELENIVNSTWLYHEIYIIDGLYEFHAILRDETSQLRYFTLSASYIDMVNDNGK